MPDVLKSRSARKRQAIMEAANRLFLDKGYDSTTMEDVAAAADVSKPTIYKRFADKEKLFAEVVGATLNHIDDLVGVVAKSLGQSKSLKSDLEHFALRFITALMEPEFIRLRRLVIANAERFPNISHTWYKQGFERFIEALAHSFERLADAGLLRIPNPRFAAHHFVGLLLWIPMNEALFDGKCRRMSKSEFALVADAAVRAFLEGHAVVRTSIRRSRSS